ncbi:hypothetical protein [Thiobaca trueperi]|nr:hypothetical protein [Thiobaca trueperi]
MSLALLIPVAASQADSLGDYPPPSDPCLADRQAAYTAGYNAGDLNGYNRGYAIGFSDGTGAGIARCFANPADCNISLASCLPDPDYGETEPNDNLIAADPLKFNTKYWAQSYGAADQDWFYIETTAANQNLAVTFAVPNLNGANLLQGNPSIWNLTIRDAAGNVFANFDTNTIGSFITQEELDKKPYQMTYRATLGLVGTYYLVVQQSDKTVKNAYTYSIAASPLENTDLDGKQPIVGFYDSEIEPNDVPSRANPLATSVTMFGLINLTFNTPLPTDETYVWGQGENDWFVYNTAGNEIISLTFCAKEACGPGNWFVEIYDKTTAQKLEDGALLKDVKPLLAFNTDTVNQPSAIYRLGLKDPGYYFMRVNHKRLFDAPCLGHQFVSTATDSGFIGSCECASGNSCDVPSDGCSEDALGLQCKQETKTCNPGIDPGCLLADGQGGRPQYPAGCPLKEDPENPDKITTPCQTYQTLARCSCSSYGGVVEIPENEYSGPYNFTWFGTKLPPNTIDTDAYLDFLNRSNPYTP